MAYTIVKSDGTVLTTIADGTINTNATSLGLPGRNYAGYGETIDTNFAHLIENFASGSPPANALKGQIWYDTSSSLLRVCPTDGETDPTLWGTLTSTASGGATTFNTVEVTGTTVQASDQPDAWDYLDGQRDHAIGLKEEAATSGVARTRTFTWRTGGDFEGEGRENGENVERCEG